MKATLKQVEALEARESALRDAILATDCTMKKHILRNELISVLNQLDAALKNAEPGVIGSVGFCLHA